MKISEKDHEKIMKHVVDYVQSTPEKEYRKHPTTYLNNKCWNDEITVKKKVISRADYKTDSTGFPMAYCKACNKHGSYRYEELIHGSKCCSADLLPERIV